MILPRLLFCVYLGCMLSFVTKAQDVHFTQWWMGGGFVQSANMHARYDVLVQAGIKSQWNGVSGVPFQMQNIHVQMPLSLLQGLSIQGNYLRDKSGDGSWIQNKWSLGCGYQWAADSSRFSWKTVMQLRRGNSHWNNGAWRFMDQWNGLYYDASTGQSEYFNQSSAWGWGLGSVSRWNMTETFDAAMGVGLFSAMQYQTKDGFTMYSWMPQKLFTMQMNFHANPLHPVRCYSLVHRQGHQQAWLNYAEWGNVMDQRSWLMSTLWLGAGCRWNDAVIAGIGMGWAGHLFRLTYDINVSPFHVATEYRGGWEIQYQYQFLKPKIISKIKSPCPPYY